VAEKTEKLNGKVVDTVGHYIPTGAEKIIVIDKEAVERWLSKGVLPSNTVAKLLNTQGFKLPVETSPERPAKKVSKEEPAKAPVAEATAEGEAVVTEAVTETPTEETPAEMVEEAVEPTEVVEEAPVVEDSVAVESATPTEEAPADTAADES
jgi:ribosomal protein S16